MHPDGKFYELKAPEKFKEELREKGFTLRNSYEDNFEIHYSGVINQPYGFLLENSFLLIYNKGAGWLQDERGIAERRENFKKLESLIMSSNCGSL